MIKINKVRGLELSPDSVRIARGTMAPNFTIDQSDLLEDGLDVAHNIIFEGMVPSILEIEVLVHARTYANKFLNYDGIENKEAEMLLNHRKIMSYIKWHYHNANKIGKYA